MSEPGPQPPTPPIQPKGAEPAPYELEPSGEGQPAPLPTDARPAAPQANLDQPRLLDAFDDDTDFSEPEPDGAAASDGHGDDNDAEAPKPLVRPMHALGDLERQILIASGGLLLLVATITSAITASSRPLAHAVATVYDGILHTATGLGALACAGLLESRPLGRLDLAAGRMLLAVAAFLLAANLELGVPTQAVESVLGLMLYAAVLFVTMREGVRVMATLISAHAAFWLVVWVALLLYAWTRPVTLVSAP